jgi:hypothetical protein
MLGPVVFAFAFYSLIWKLPTLMAGVSTDLARHGGLLDRARSRLGSIDDVYRVVKYFLLYSRWYALGLVLVSLAALIWRRRLGMLLLPAVTTGAYALLLFGVYLSTYHDLSWHLETSADRVFLPFNLGTATLVLLMMDQVLTRYFTTDQAMERASCAAQDGVSASAGHGPAR